MDYVENLITKKIKSLLKNFDNKNEMINVANQKLKSQKQGNYLKQLDDYKIKLEKSAHEIDSIYNDKLNGVLSENDFCRIYKMKKQEETQIKDKIEKIETYLNSNILDEKEIIDKLIKKFKAKIKINREILTDLIDRIEIDKNKKIYVFFKFKSLNSDSP